MREKEKEAIPDEYQMSKIHLAGAVLLTMRGWDWKIYLIRLAEPEALERDDDVLEIDSKMRRKRIEKKKKRKRKFVSLYLVLLPTTDNDFRPWC